MKERRLAIISELIEEYPVNTQEELQRLLSERGYVVTQATVSRDIKELGLGKTLDSDGNYRYSAPRVGPMGDRKAKYELIFRESVVSLVGCGNLVVIKCFTGMGNAACEALDVLGFDSIVGTVAGDNTIFVAVDSLEDSELLVSQLQKLINS